AEQLAQAGYSVRFYDIAADIAVPTVLARIKRDRVVSPGWGTHPNPAVACHRALLEACQTIANVIAGGREDLTVQARSLGRHERPKPIRAAAEAFWSRRDLPRATVVGLGGAAHDDVTEDFRWIRRRLVEGGASHLLALNLSPPEISPASVVRVVI